MGYLIACGKVPPFSVHFLFTSWLSPLKVSLLLLSVLRLGVHLPKGLQRRERRNASGGNLVFALLLVVESSQLKVRWTFFWPQLVMH